MSSLPRKSSIDSCRLSCESCELLANDIEANLSNHPKRSPENGDDERKERSFLLHGFLWSKYQWVLLGLWILSILLSVQITRWGMSTANNYEIGFSTDLRQYSSQTATLKTPAHNGSEPAIEAIELETVRFTGDLLIDPNGTIYRNIEGKQYVGEPSPDIDSAWRDIIRGTGVDLTTSDAERAGVIGKTYQKSSGHYLAGMHIFHELHCLNKLRKASHPDYYNDYDGESYDYWRQHLDHCIDSLRQTLMCNGDISLVTVDWIEARNRTVPDLDNLHTCRNFSKLQEWALRHNAEEHPNNHPTEDQRKEAWFKEIPA